MKPAPLFSFLFLFLICLSSSHAQQNKTKPITTDVKVIVTDMQDKPRKGEQILFVSKKTKKEFKGISNEKGEFKLNLATGDTFEIKIKAIGDAQDYSSVAIPELHEGEQFTGELELTVKFEPGRMFTLNNVHFDSGKATLRKDSYSELNELVDYMKWKTEETIEIAGHTDNVGSKESNLRLSQARAEAIRTYLISKGIKGTHVIAKGYGDTQPVSKNDTEESRAKNRRTEVRVIEK